MSPILAPNREQMLEHLTLLFGRAQAGKIEITALHALKQGGPKWAFFDVDQLEEAADFAASLNNAPNWNVYVGASLRRDDVFPGSVGDDSDFFRTYAVWADADDEAQLASARAAYQAAGAAPPFVVVTGRTPHRRAQFWWPLEAPITEADALRATVRGIADALGTDHGVLTAKQLMRLAGGVSWPKLGKEGRVLEPTEISKPSNAAWEFSLEQLHRAFPPPAPHEPRERPPEAGGTLLGSLAAVDLRSALACMRSDDRELWVRMGLALKSLGDQGRGLWLEWSQTSDKYDPVDAAKTWDSFKPERTSHAAVFAEAARQGWENPGRGRPAAEPEAYDPETGEVIDPEPEEGPFQASSFAGDPPEREWVADEWIVRGAVNSLYGDGGLGKTLLIQQLACSVSLGTPWLGIPTHQGSVLAVLCEDDTDELHRRHNAIKAAAGHSLGNPYSDVWLWPRVGRDNVLIRWNRDGQPTLGAFYDRIVSEVRRLHPSLLILDTLADFYAGNEIDRPSVNYFVKTVLGGLILSEREAGHSLTVLLLGHPSVAGKSSGSGYSGSTAWNNAVRSRMYLTRPDGDEAPADERILTRGKANYAKSGDETAVRLFYADGVLHACEDAEDGDSILWAAKREVSQLVDRAWNSGSPYSAQKGHRRYIHSALAPELLKGGFNVQIARQAVREAIEDGAVRVSNSNGKRGYRSGDNA